MSVQFLLVVSLLSSCVHGASEGEPDLSISCKQFTDEQTCKNKGCRPYTNKKNNRFFCHPHGSLVKLCWSQKTDEECKAAGCLVRAPRSKSVPKESTMQTKPDIRPGKIINKDGKKSVQKRPFNRPNFRCNPRK